MLTQSGISLNSVISITTDGAPSMLGQERGAVTPLKEDSPDLKSYHCISHQCTMHHTLGGIWRGHKSCNLSQGMLISSAWWMQMQNTYCYTVTFDG